MSRLQARLQKRALYLPYISRISPLYLPNQVSRLQARLQKRGLVRKTADAKGGAH